MDKRKYFSDLRALYEQTALNEDAPMADPNSQAMAQQAQIADSGADVMPQEQIPPEENPNMDPTADPGMMGMPPAQDQPQPETGSSFELNKQKSLKLLDYLNDLYDYGSVFIDSLKAVDMNLLEGDRYAKFLEYNKNIEKLVEKINNYIVNLFATDDYERQLYSYVMFRTELVSNIKMLRDVLDLNHLDEPIKPEESK